MNILLDSYEIAKIAKNKKMIKDIMDSCIEKTSYKGENPYFTILHNNHSIDMITSEEKNIFINKDITGNIYSLPEKISYEEFIEYLLNPTILAL